MELYFFMLHYRKTDTRWTHFSISATNFRLLSQNLKYLIQDSFHFITVHSPQLSVQFFFCFSFRPFQAYHFDCVNIFVCFGFVNVWMYPLLVVRIQTEERWWIFQTQGWAREGPVCMWQWCLERYLDPLLPLFRFYLV